MSPDPAEALLHTRPQRAAAAVHRFAIRHGLPRLHWCIFDRHCRYFDAPWRVTVLWGRHHAWLDATWSWPPITGGRSSSPRTR